VVADGNPVVWLSRLAGRPVDLIPGSELVGPLCALAARAGVAVALMGATDATLERAAAALEAAHPGLCVAVRIAPPMGFDPDGPAADAAIAAIGASGAGLVLLALGAPRQERFAARAARALPRCGFVSIGAGLDFIAGTQVRAPAWARAAAMEWAWRMARDPRRLAARYAACFAVLPAETAAALRVRPRPRPRSR
jgi:exopolysaccharide biosynthesis WecB/TagA/CpsF family protein